ncbi:MAG: hypothetical protein Q9227_009135 [Pyrenula ochraceoflavens]
MSKPDLFKRPLPHESFLDLSNAHSSDATTLDRLREHAEHPKSDDPWKVKYGGCFGDTINCEAVKGYIHPHEFHDGIVILKKTFERDYKVIKSNEHPSGPIRYTPKPPWPTDGNFIDLKEKRIWYNKGPEIPQDVNPELGVTNSSSQLRYCMWCSQTHLVHSLKKLLKSKAAKIDGQSPPKILDEIGEFLRERKDKKGYQPIHKFAIDKMKEIESEMRAKYQGQWEAHKPVGNWGTLKGALGGWPEAEDVKGDLSLLHY